MTRFIIGTLAAACILLFGVSTANAHPKDTGWRNISPPAFGVYNQMRVELRHTRCIVRTRSVDQFGNEQFVAVHATAICRGHDSYGEKRHSSVGSVKVEVDVWGGPEHATGISQVGNGPVKSLGVGH